MSTTIKLTPNKIVKKKCIYITKKKLKNLLKKYKKLKTRKLIEYDNEKERQIICLNEMIKCEFEAWRDTTLKTFPDSDACAKKIFAHFENLQCLAIFVFALTQSGKTGLLRALVKLWSACTTKMIINAQENIYLITGLSSVDWKKQMKERFPTILEKNIYHRGQLTGKKNKAGVEKFCKSIKGKQNCLILMDEIQIACAGGQTISKSFKEIGIFDEDYCFKNDIKIVEVTATPDGVGIDLANKWPYDNYKMIRMDPGPGHTSQLDYLDTLDDPTKKTRLYQYKDCVNCKNKKEKIYDDEESEKNIREYKKILLENFQDDPRYHFVRLNTQHGDKHIENLKKVFSEDEYKYIEFNSKTTKKDWGVGSRYEEDDRVNLNDDLLKIKPSKHTFILTKELLRCSHTIHKEYVGSGYERAAKKHNDSSQIQGFPGRFTGYDVPNDIIVFTNIDTIRRYKKIYEAEGDLKKAGVTWNSTTTKNKNGVSVPRKGTFMGEMSPVKKGKVIVSPMINKHKEFKNWEDANKFILDKFGKKFLKKPFEKRLREGKNGEAVKPAEAPDGRIMNCIRRNWKIIDASDKSDWYIGLGTVKTRLLVTYDGDGKVPMFVVVWKKESSI